MISNAVLAAAFGAAMTSMSFTADPSPQPTTSPTTSGKMQLGKTEVSQFVNTRSAIRKNIAKFNELVEAGAKSKKQQQDLNRLAQDITKQAAQIQKYSQLTKNSQAERIAAALLLDDDVGGRQSARQATAKRLLELDAKLGLLEPIGNR